MAKSYTPIAALLVNPDNELGLMLAPILQDTVERVEIDGYTRKVRIQFEGGQWPIEIEQELSAQSLQAATRSDKIYVAHFKDMNDFAACDSSREYEVPLV